MELTQGSNREECIAAIEQGMALSNSPEAARLVAPDENRTVNAVNHGPDQSIRDYSSDVDEPTRAQSSSNQALNATPASTLADKRVEQLRNLLAKLGENHDIPDEFLCPITTEVMEEPVVAMDGHTYEKRAIESWYAQHKTSPVTREAVDTTLIPNRSMQSQISSWCDRGGK